MIKYIGKRIELAIHYWVMLFVIIISIGPFFWFFLSSFKNNMEILGSALSWPSHFSFVSYVDAIKLTHLNLYFFNSIIISSVATAVGLLIYSLAAYVLARFEFPFRNAIYIILSLSLLIPGNAMIQPIYKLIQWLHLYDTKMGLMLVYAAFGLPVTLFILKNYFASIPKELEESAYLEGAGFLTTYVRIVLPLATPAFASAGVLMFLSAWNDFLYALMLTTSQSNRTLPLSLNYFVKSFSYDYAALFAALIMTILPSIVIYVLLQEQISKSLIGGAVKG